MIFKLVGGVCFKNKYATGTKSMIDSAMQAHSKFLWYMTKHRYDSIPPVFTHIKVGQIGVNSYEMYA
jgi:hypothetical protein